MLKNLTISAKTGLGFGLILLFMATMFFFAIRGLQNASDSFTEYRRLARSSVLSGTSPGQHADCLQGGQELLEVKGRKAAGNL